MASTFNTLNTGNQLLPPTDWMFSPETFANQNVVDLKPLLDGPPTKKKKTEPKRTVTRAAKSKKKTSTTARTNVKKTTASRKRKASNIPDVIPPNAKIEIIQTVQVGAAKLKKSDPNYDKKLRRLLRNRQVARDCRRRKREKMEQLENEVVTLREWNRQLEIKLNEGREGTEKEEARQRQLKKIRTLLQSRRSESEIAQAMEEFTASYADFGSERNAAIAFHVRQLKSLLLPTQFCKMTLWSLQQQDEFYNENSNQQTFGGGIWNMISNTCKFSEDQKKRLTEHTVRDEIRKQRDNMASALHCLDDLESMVHENSKTLESSVRNLQQIASPSQQAKYLLWIEDNQNCMQMLNNMWAERNESVLGAVSKVGPSPAMRCSSPSLGNNNNNMMMNNTNNMTNALPLDPSFNYPNTTDTYLDLTVDPLSSPGELSVVEPDAMGNLFYLPPSPSPSIF